MKKTLLLVALFTPLITTANVSNKDVFDNKPICNQLLHETKPQSKQLIAFAEHVVVEAFSYDYMNVDSKINQLKACFTALGWKSFRNALRQSGNIQTSKKDKLTLVAQTQAGIKIGGKNDNGWKLSVPLKVKYENKTHELIQHLNVSVIIDIEKDRLGIAQLVATPKREDKPAGKKTSQDSMANVDTGSPSASSVTKTTAGSPSAAPEKNNTTAPRPKPAATQARKPGQITDPRDN